MSLMSSQDTYFSALVMEERTMFALSAYTFRGQWGGQGGASGLRERSACGREMRKLFTLPDVDNVKCVACAHLTFCESQISQGSAAPRKHRRYKTQLFLSPLSFTEALAATGCGQA